MPAKEKPYDPIKDVTADLKRLVKSKRKGKQPVISLLTINLAHELSSSLRSDRKETTAIRKGEKVAQIWPFPNRDDAGNVKLAESILEDTILLR